MYVQDCQALPCVVPVCDGRATTPAHSTRRNLMLLMMMTDKVTFMELNLGTVIQRMVDLGSVWQDMYCS